LKILVVDDDKVTCELLNEVLTKEKYEVDTASSFEQALEKGAAAYDILISDIKLQDGNGLELLKRFKDINPSIVVVLITAFGNIDNAIEAIKEGAFDYISKPFKLDEIKQTIKRATNQKKVVDEKVIKELEQEEKEGYKIIGASQEMFEVSKIVARVSSTTSTVLITGESGTGKELIAKAIHESSERRNNPFLTVNCSALTETLLESELFGYVKGAFTGALSYRKGIFETATSGTCFLDEIGDISLAMQSKLLRVLQEQEIKPVGSSENIKVDVRIIAATNKNLEAMVKERIFREDLYYRLNVVSINIPPLRDRKEDISKLAYHFLAKYRKKYNKIVYSITQDSMNYLLAYSWNGNVRELENVIERAVALTVNPAISVDDLPEKIKTAAIETVQDILSKRLTLEELEKKYVEIILRETSFNKLKTSEILGINKTTLYRMAERLKIDLKKGN